MNNLTQQIEETVKEFVTTITALAQKVAMESLGTALGAAVGGGVAEPRGGRPQGRSASATTASRKPGAKRPADELKRITTEVLDYVRNNPGSRIELLTKALGYKTKDVSLPMKKLIAEGFVRTEGEKRATAYFPAGRRSRQVS